MTTFHFYFDLCQVRIFEKWKAHLYACIMHVVENSIHQCQCAYHDMMPPKPCKPSSEASTLFTYLLCFQSETALSSDLGYHSNDQNGA